MVPRPQLAFWQNLASPVILRITSNFVVPVELIRPIRLLAVAIEDWAMTYLLHRLLRLAGVGRRRARCFYPP